mmetsp:Transcript_58977/g.151645  ORF Transcript_58977/g.151645 Transcript_58977/m.151645 type:complete len:209 (-) Transcript_58977:722-1348(-)
MWRAAGRGADAAVGVHVDLPGVPGREALQRLRRRRQLLHVGAAEGPGLHGLHVLAAEGPGRGGLHQLAQVGEEVQQALRHRGDVQRQLHEARAAELLAVRHEVARGRVEAREARLRREEVQRELHPRRPLIRRGAGRVPLGRVHLLEEDLYEERHRAEQQPDLVHDREDAAEVQPDVLGPLQLLEVLGRRHQVQRERHQPLGEVEQHA